MRPLIQRIEAQIERGLIVPNLTVRMSAVQEAPHQNGAQSVPDISCILEIPRQYAQLMVHETQVTGLTAKIPNPRYACSSLPLTEAGRNQIKDILAQDANILTQLADGLDADDVATGLKQFQRSEKAGSHPVALGRSSVIS